MHQISKSAIVPYSPKKMYELVNAIEDYPQFLNWCNSTTILNQTANEITASVEINKSGLNHSFTTLNKLKPYHSIEMDLLDGPFKKLAGEWRFLPLGENATKIHLDLEFVFRSKIMDLALAPIFSKITNSQLNAFIARAKEIHG
jgi:ribosome-associated toxin RatA of RatAB toxin-antitoxin module